MRRFATSTTTVVATTAGAAATAALVAVWTDGFLGDASVVLSLFLALVALGLAVAAVLEWHFGRETPTTRHDRHRAVRMHPSRCGGCGSRMQRRHGIRLCHACDLTAAR
jgi:hypothetical protein